MTKNFEFVSAEYKFFLCDIKSHKSKKWKAEKVPIIWNPFSEVF